MRDQTKPNKTSERADHAILGYSDDLGKKVISIWSVRLLEELEAQLKGSSGKHSTTVDVPLCRKFYKEIGVHVAKIALALSVIAPAKGA